MGYFGYFEAGIVFSNSHIINVVKGRLGGMEC